LPGFAFSLFLDARFRTALTMRWRRAVKGLEGPALEIPDDRITIECFGCAWQHVVDVAQVKFLVTWREVQSFFSADGWRFSHTKPSLTTTMQGQHASTNHPDPV